MFRFRLRTLMAGVTLFAVLLFGRLEYIRRQIAFHRREAASAHAAVAEKEHQPIAAALEDWRKAAHHERVADAYERALVRPWTLVDDTISTATMP
jgi:hypothetical protein